jgi:predicted dehydrogenase
VPPTRAAIVGTGNIADDHATALKALGAEIVAAVDVDPARLRAFCDSHGIERSYAQLDRMLADVRPELVHVCSPPSVHHVQALACLAAGATVVLEKPPTITLRELDELAAAQGGAGPWVATVFQHRFGSGVQRLRALMQDGALGRPLLAICHTTWFREQAWFDVPWRAAGGGPTMTLGIHQMDLLCAILGEWTEVSAITRRQARRTEGEDLSLAHISFANGAVASVVNSVVSPRQETYLRFDFERATVELTHLYGYTDADWRITGDVPWEGPDVASSHHVQIAAVLQALEQGTPPPVTTADVRPTMQLVAALHASASTGTRFNPQDVGPGSDYYDVMPG